MHVFFRKIPAHTKQNDLIGFIEPALKRMWFRNKGVIENIRIVHQKDHGSNVSEYHAVVTIEPDVVAEKVIKRLNRKMFLGRHVIVREYHRRVWHNDLRIKHNSRNLKISCRRITDRRRKNLEMVKEVAHKFSGDKSFHRQHN